MPQIHHVSLSSQPSPRPEPTAAGESELNRETLEASLDLAITPADRFYTRSHFSVPIVDGSSWQLSVEGEDSGQNKKKKSMVFGLSDLQRMEQRKVTVTLECAGNGRRHFGKPIEGEVLWGDGAVGTAMWTGVPLRSLLQKQADVVSERSRAVYFEGLDEKTDGEAFLRYLPLEKVLHEDTILALKMNGDELPPEHGYPCRLIVPGWYAMASVKWLSRIRVSSEERPYSYFNDEKYVFKTAGERDTTKTPVREMRVKSIISSPREGEALSLKKNGGVVSIRGKAWSGSGRITRVEFRGGADDTWLEAKLDREASGEEAKYYGWTSWSVEWTPKTLGRVPLSSRATDEAGHTQPDEPEENAFQYGYNAASTKVVEVIA